LITHVAFSICKPSYHTMASIIYNIRSTYTNLKIILYYNHFNRTE